jgi:hypothetical protein
LKQHFLCYAIEFSIGILKKNHYAWRWFGGWGGAQAPDGSASGHLTCAIFARGAAIGRLPVNAVGLSAWYEFAEAPDGLLRR